MFLHGATGEGETHFGHLADRFSDRRKVFLPDFAGSGTSSLPDGPFTLDQLVDEVVGVIDGIDAGVGGSTPPAPIDLVGFSLGAVVAAALAATHAERVRRLVLIAGWVSSDDARHQFVLDTWARSEHADPELFARLGPILAFSPPFLSGLGRDGIEQMLSAGLPPATGRQIDVGRRIDIRRHLPDITAPTLVVGCTHDGLVPVEHARALHGAIAGSRYAELDSGHAVMFEKPDELTQLLRSFLVDES